MLRSPLALFALTSLLSAQIAPAPDIGTTEAPPQVVRGRVTDGGQPVAGATVHLSFRRYPLTNALSEFATQTILRATKSGADGGFSLPMPPWRHCAVWALHNGKASQVVDDVISPAPELELQLERAWTVTGRFRHDGGAPTEKLAFRLTRVTTAEDAVAIRVEGTSNGDGSFAVPDLPPGPWSLALAAGKYRVGAPVVFEESGSSVDVALDRGIEVHCLLADETDSSPIAGARVELLDVSNYYVTKTDPDGAFTLRGLAEGPGASLLIDAPNNERKIVVLEPGLAPGVAAPQAVLTLPAGMKARGRITDPSGKPVAGLEILFKCFIHISSLSWHDLSLVTKTDAQGNFETDLLETASLYTLHAMLPSHEAQEFATVDFRPHMYKPDAGTFRLGTRRVETTLQVTGGAMHPYDMRVYGPRKSGNIEEYKTMLRTKRGTWISPCLQPGRYVTLAVSKTLGAGRQVFDMTTMDSGPATVTGTCKLAAPKEVRGVVVDRQGRPIENASVFLVFKGAFESNSGSSWSDVIVYEALEKLFPEKDNPRTVTTEKDGTFTFRCYEGSGTYDVLARRARDPSKPAIEGEGTTRISDALRQKMPLRLVIE